MKPESLTLADGDQVELNEDGFVASVTLGDGSGRYYYTKGPFLFEDFKEKELRWYHENGELALEGRFIDPFKDPSPVTIKYLVASEVLTDTLAKQGYDTKFLPPMFT